MNLSMNLSLRMRLVSMVGVLSLLTLALVAYMARQNYQALVDSKGDLVRSAAASVMDKIDRNLFERYGDVQAFAQSEPARSGDQKRIQAFMNDMMAAYAPIYDVMLVLNANGIVVAVNSVDKAGKPLDSTTLLGRNYSDAPWFKAAVENQIKPGTAHVEDTQTDKEVGSVVGSDGRIMRFTSPIRDGNEILGVWTNCMSWNDVAQAIAKEEIAKIKSERMPAVLVSILDKKGTYLINTENPSSELKERKDITNFAAQAEDSQIRTIKNSRSNEEFLEASTKSKGYSTYAARGWIATLSTPKFDSSLGLILTTAISLIVAILLFNVFCFWFAHRLGRSFEGLLRSLSAASSKVESLSGDIKHSSSSLARSCSQQVSAIQTTVASSEEMSSMLKQTNTQASQSLEITERGRKESQNGRAVVSRLGTSMDEIQGANQRLDGIVKLISEIKEKTAVINEIVSETRLLSFNASIEAARAGSHGKGFAVVAEEVGKLATMSGKAASEIQRLLDSSTVEVSEVVHSSQVRINGMKAISDDCERTFNQMGVHLEKIDGSVKQIVSATREQEIGVSQTNSAMAEMDKATSANSSGADRLSAFASSLADGANSLAGSIQQLNDVVFGRNFNVDKRATTDSPVSTLHQEDQSVRDVTTLSA